MNNKSLKKRVKRIEKDMDEDNIVRNLNDQNYTHVIDRLTSLVKYQTICLEALRDDLRALEATVEEFITPSATKAGESFFITGHLDEYNIKDDNAKRTD